MKMTMTTPMKMMGTQSEEQAGQHHVTPVRGESACAVIQGMMRARQKRFFVPLLIYYFSVRRIFVLFCFVFWFRPSKVQKTSKTTMKATSGNESFASLICRGGSDNFVPHVPSVVLSACRVWHGLWDALSFSSSCCVVLCFFFFFCDVPPHPHPRRAKKQEKKGAMVKRATTAPKAAAGRRKEGKKENKLTIDPKVHSSTLTPAQRQQQLSSKRKEALQKALVSAFSAPHANAHSDATVDVDEYGKGSPTDRLQFGYAPSNAAEAIAFHSAIPAKKWIAERRKQACIAIVKKQKLPRPNCEPMTSLLKLKEHWREKAQFVAELRGGGVGQESADELLEMFVSQQRVA
ncbi:hypothetical protein MOQ_001465 [Trypanosoma cruzi marinkellei]|uniref:Uncharacterized protein n=1 Tax=Trypanosoma cruzi marinkellei TaxID=85056 RepID=K2NTG7_TRYCR|nr:hypothetical protein MOQ_001465 [Trypanosoma cruzi marinkellei]